MDHHDPSARRTPATRSARHQARRARRSRRAAAWAWTALAAVILTAVAVGAVAGGIGPRARQAADSSTTAAIAAEPAGVTAPSSGPTLMATSEPTVAAPPPSLPATLTITAVGDMIFDRRVAELIRARGGAAPLADLDDLLADADVTIGNLESNLSDGGSRNTAKDVTFRGDPRGLDGLVDSGFDVLSLANNHALDYGPEALLDTIAALDSAGIAHAGAGVDRAAAWAPAIIERDGATVAYLASSHIVPAGFPAGESRAGIAAGRTNMDEVCEAVRAAKEQADYVIVSFHWGIEYVDDANAEQVRDARAAVDAGADMVLAHHPHVIQGIEVYDGKLIAYSLGDFVFDHYSRKTGEAFVLDAELGPYGVSDIVITPVYLDTYGAPAIVTGSEAEAILSRLETISAKHGTDVVIDGDTARVVF